MKKRYMEDAVAVKETLTKGVKQLSFLVKEW